MLNWRLRWEMTLWAIFCIFLNRFQWTHIKFCHWYSWCFSISGSASHQSWKLWRIPVLLRKVRFPVLINNIYVTSKRCISLSSKRLKSIILAAFLASVNSLLKNGFTPWTKDVWVTCELSELQKSLSLKAVRPSLKVLAPKMELRSCASKNTFVLKDKFCSHNVSLPLFVPKRELFLSLKNTSLIETWWTRSQRMCFDSELRGSLDHHDSQPNILGWLFCLTYRRKRQKT